MLAVVVIVAVAGAVWFVQNGQTTAQAVAKQSHPETVRFAYVPAPFNAVPIIALRNGYFADEGLQVEEVRASFVGYVFQELLDGNVDVLSGAETPAVFMAFKSSEFRIIAKHEENKNDLVMVTRTESKINSVRDLVGKKVGLPFTSVCQYNLWKLLRENGVNYTAVQQVDLAPQNMASALSHGDVDAVFAWEPTPSKIIEGLGSQVSSFTPDSSWMMNVYVSKQFSTHTDTEEKFLRALLRAQEFLIANKTQAISIVANETNLDLGTLSALWGHWKFNVTEFNDAEVMVGQAVWAKEIGLVNVTGIPDFAAMVDSVVVREVLDEANKSV